MVEIEVNQEEAALIRRCQQGDSAAFDLLIAAHANRVYNLSYRLLGSAADAEDASQEAFVRAFSSLRRFRGQAAFSTWLHRIALNVCRDELKRRRRRPLPFASLQGENDDSPSEPEDFLLGGDAAADPQALLEKNLRKEQVQAALNALPEYYRLAVVLCDMEGRTYEEAAEILNTNVGTVKSRLHRARQSLQQILAPVKELSSPPVSQKI